MGRGCAVGVIIHQTGQQTVRETVLAGFSELVLGQECKLYPITALHVDCLLPAHLVEEGIQSAQARICAQLRLLASFALLLPCSFRAFPSLPSGQTRQIDGNRHLLPRRAVRLKSFGRSGCIRPRTPVI